MSKLIRILGGYLDENGYPGTIQSDGTYDGGDTAAIIGTVNFFDRDILKVGCPITYAGVNFYPTRHPDQTKWYGQPDRFSRDQLIPNICSIIKIQNDYDLSFPYNPVSILYLAHSARYFLTAWNTRGNGAMDMPKKLPDFCGPEIWALWLRNMKPWWMRAVLGILDIQTLIGAIQWRWFTPKTNQITRNHMLVCLTIKRYSPTWIGNLAYWINDWQDLTDRWEACNNATGEYPTYPLFKAYLGLK